MVNANKALEAFRDVLECANINRKGAWICNPYDPVYEGKPYQFCTDGLRAYAIPAVIEEEDFDGLPRSVNPTPPQKLEMFKPLFEEHKGEGYRRVKLPSMALMEKAEKDAKYYGYINRRYELGDGMSLVLHAPALEDYPLPVLDMGEGLPKLYLHQLMRVLKMIQHSRVLVGSPVQPVTFTDGEAYALIMPLIPRAFDEAMVKGEYAKEKSGWKL